MRTLQLLYFQDKNENIHSVYAGLRKNYPKILCSSSENLSKIGPCIYIFIYLCVCIFWKFSLLALYPISLLLKCAIYFSEIHENVHIIYVYILQFCVFFFYNLYRGSSNLHNTPDNWNATKPLLFYRIHDCDVTTYYCIHAELTASWN